MNRDITRVLTSITVTSTDAIVYATSLITKLSYSLFGSGGEKITILNDIRVTCWIILILKFIWNISVLSSYWLNLSFFEVSLTLLLIDLLLLYDQLNKFKYRLEKSWGILIKLNFNFNPAMIHYNIVYFLH